MGEVITDVFGDRAREGGGGSSPEDMALFPRNDIGNAMRLILLAGGAVRKSGQVDSLNSTLLYRRGGGWIGFNGVYWDQDLGEELARKLAHQVANLLPSLYPFWVELEKMPPKEFFKFCNESGSAGKTSAMLRQAQSYLMVEIDAFDRDPMALTCLNGTVKMRWRDGQFSVSLEDHTPADRITRCCTVGFDAAASCPLFESIVKTSMPDKAERRYLHQTLGYGSTGYAHEQVFFFFQGRGSDGKSTILDACRETIGSYGLAAAPATFLEGGMKSGSDAAPDLIALSGDTRLAVLSEPPRGSKMNEGLLKSWTSGSPISARDLHAKPINFRPKAKLFFEMNSFVVARGDDDGIWRRLRPLLFRHQVKEKDRDRLLPKKLEPERPGILNWLIAGVGDWLEVGALAPPESLIKVVEDYRRSSSPFGDWLAEFCVVGEEAGEHRELSSALYASFKSWSEDSGNDRVMAAAAFGNALRDRQIGLRGKNANGNKYRGPIRLKTPAERLIGSEEAGAFVAPAGGGSAPAGEFGLGDLDLIPDANGPEDYSGS